MKESSTKKFKIKKQYFRQGTMLFLVGAALILFYYLVNHMPALSNSFSKLNSILLPFYLGLIMAYLLCPIYNNIVKLVYRLLSGKLKNPVKDLKASRIIATIISVTFIGALVCGFIMLVVPGIWDSIMLVIPKVRPAFDQLLEWVQRHLEQNPDLVRLLEGKIDNISQTVSSWIQKKALPGAEALISGVSSGVIGTIGTLFNILVALIICIYLLNSKETFLAQGRKLILAIFSKERAESIFELARLSNQTFGGFINGKIIDSIIIGILCAVSMLILKLPLVVLVSVIVGITNIIPFFGPFIGAIPSALLIFIISPVAALKFLILVVVLQQLDGNIIGPKILGKATKLSSFWVMFAIIVSGGLFGFVGMVLGVPVFAILYVYIAKGVNKKLAMKSLPTDTLIYQEFTKYNIDKSKLYGIRRWRENDEDKGTGTDSEKEVTQEQDNR